MITAKQFREAMVIVENYCDQVLLSKTPVVPQTHEIGCRVKLNEFGIKMQGKRKSKLTGTVVYWLDWHSTETFKDGLVTVKWDGIKKPVSMHVGQVEIA